MSAESSGWVTMDVAARALGVSPRTVRRFIERGKLEGRKVERGIVGTWEVSIDSLHALRSRRGADGHVRSKTAEESAATDIPADSVTDILRELTLRLEQRAASEAELRSRLELTERTESTIREERNRLLAELEREREEHKQTQEEARQLREELESERSKGFWRRLFGG